MRKKRNTRKMKKDMARDERFHKDMCDEQGKAKLRFGSKMSGMSTHMPRTRKK